MRSSKEGTEASRSGSFENGQEWGKKCFDDLDRRRMGRPATRTWSTDFLLREESSRNTEMDKKQVHTMATAEKIASGVTGTFSCGQQMQKYGYRTTAACKLCQKVHEEGGGSWNGEPFWTGS